MSGTYYTDSEIEEIEADYAALMTELKELKQAVRWLSSWTIGQQSNAIRGICESVLNPPEGWIQAENPEKDQAHARALQKCWEGYIDAESCKIFHAAIKPIPKWQEILVRTFGNKLGIPGHYSLRGRLYVFGTR